MSHPRHLQLFARLPHYSLRRTHPTQTISLRARPFTSTSAVRQNTASQHNPRPNFYRTHGRAFFKSLTLAFLSYQVFYWAWLTISTEETMDRRNNEIRSLEGEVRLLEEGRTAHGLRSSSSSSEGSGSR